MAEAVELPPRVLEILRTSAEGQEWLKQNQGSWLDYVNPLKIVKSIWRNKKKVLLGAGTILSLGHSAGLWAKIAPHMKMLNMEGFFNGLNASGKWVGDTANYFWGWLKFLWKGIPESTGLSGIPGYIDQGHTWTVDKIKKYGTDLIPPMAP